MNRFGRVILGLCAVLALFGAVNPGSERHSDEPEKLTLIERLSARALCGAIRRFFFKNLMANLNITGSLTGVLIRRLCVEGKHDHCLDKTCACECHLLAKPLELG